MTGLELIPVVLTVGTTAGAIVGASWWQQKKREELRRALDGDPDVEIASELKWFTPVAIQTRPPRRAARMAAAGGGKNNPSRWDILSRCEGMKTTVSVSREGFSGVLREAVGMKDVHVGDESFDKLVCLRGSVGDAVRGIFTSASVQQATRALLEDKQLWSFRIDDASNVHARYARYGIDPVDMKGKILRVVALADAIENAADRPALPDPGSSVRTQAIGGGSGAPVSIPLGDRR